MGPSSALTGSEGPGSKLPGSLPASGGTSDGFGSTAALHAGRSDRRCIKHTLPLRGEDGKFTGERAKSRMASRQRRLPRPLCPRSSSRSSNSTSSTVETRSTTEPHTSRSSRRWVEMYRAGVARRHRGSRSRPMPVGGGSEDCNHDLGETITCRVDLISGGAS